MQADGDVLHSGQSDGTGLRVSHGGGDPSGGDDDGDPGVPVPTCQFYKTGMLSKII